MSNRLSHETSPYLRQHAENPVDGYPWGEEAVRRAREEDKPVHISVGYAVCHWCHVMAHESFENPAIARLMNEHFINIKVDRQERPDLDDIYQKVVQMTGGGVSAEDVPIGQGRHPVGGQPAAYVCRNRSCDAPVTSAQALLECCTA